jgi:uncharacterized phage protein (TIGR01671 family)
MREILFRGKDRCGSGEWFYGQYLPKSKTICTEEVIKGTVLYRDLFVIPETVGQYTGLTDANGKKIFEGDIVKAQDEIYGSPFCYGITGKIVFEECAYFIEPKNPIESQWLFNECAVYEVIGNIHDNPELLN